MKKLRTHYDNLKVTQDAPQEIIKAAYKMLAQKYHPDKNPDDGNSARVMEMINEAYRILSDPVERKIHDDWIAKYHMEYSSEHKAKHYRSKKNHGGHNIDRYGEDGYTDLMRAVKLMDVEAVESLVSDGANPNLRDANFGTATALSMANLLFKRAKDIEVKSKLTKIIRFLDGSE